AVTSKTEIKEVEGEIISPIASVLRHYWPFKSLNLKKRSKTPCGMHKIQVLTSSIAVTINDGLRLVEKRR
ncbi:hypothetical protein WUBG_15319, partial [Wuchereria bancrofti]